ncbi:Flp pilus assembly protein CpaB [Roseixanthobacter liquoris]|uniref:Flp pilus assembly protein CpaB n=1 Tax=Roseixanthobacter liquoris TaxID=3119921 RepID=UPI00372AF8AB
MLRVIILVVALAAGGLAAWLVWAMRSGSPTPPQVVRAQPVATEVLVAAADLPQGHVILAKDLRWQIWKQPLSPTLISRAEKPNATATLLGSAVRGRFVAGEPILEEKLSRNQAGMLASMLPSGKRAVAIRISAESTAGGFILPNDRVDVIQSAVRPSGAQGEVWSRTLLRNIRVLAVDQQADGSKGMAVVGKTVTLEVDPPQVQVLVVAGQVAGSLSLALRSAADDDETAALAPEGATIRILRAGQSEIVRTQ